MQKNGSAAAHDSIYTAEMTTKKKKKNPTEESGSVPLSQRRSSGAEETRGRLTTSCYQSSHQIKENAAALGHPASRGAIYFNIRDPLQDFFSVNIY